MRFAFGLALLAVVGLLATSTLAHDIPNARVDRSIQVDLTPGKLQIEYEVSLAELTLTQDLRSLIGSLPKGDRVAWFQRYGEVTGPLNAQGFLIRVDQTEIPLKVEGFRLVVEDHPRFFFRFSADLPPAGRLFVRDTNYAGSEGTSRLAVRGQNGVKVTGDDLPGDVTQIPLRPVWQLSNEEEKRTKQVVVPFQPGTTEAAPKLAPASPPPPSSAPVVPQNPLTRLLDRVPEHRLAWLLLGLSALGLGAVHALQPGHGKTLASAGALGSAHPWRSAVILGLSTTTSHLATVVVIALGLALSGASSYAAIHQPLLRTAGFVIAATGLWRLGREVGRNQPTAEQVRPLPPSSDLALIGLGLAAGMVPCWEAIALVVIAASIGQLALGIFLVSAFSLGLGIVLVGFAGLAGKVSRQFDRSARLLRVAGALLLAGVGGWFLIG